MKITRRQIRNSSTVKACRELLDRLLSESKQTKVERLPNVGKVRPPTVGAANIAGQ